jgi:Bacterial aa3 type cytochrome c oxidase subunit IV
MAVETDHDLQPHLDTWHAFVKWLFRCAAAVVLVLVLLAIFFL